MPISRTISIAIKPRVIVNLDRFRAKRFRSAGRPRTALSLRSGPKATRAHSKSYREMKLRVLISPRAARKRSRKGNCVGFNLRLATSSDKKQA